MWPRNNNKSKKRGLTPLILFGDYKKSVEYLSKAYAIYLEKMGDAHPDTKTIKANLDAAKSKAKSQTR
jgi:hypothetical protein